MKTDWTHFAGDLLKHSRAQAGLSQHQLATLAGVSNAEVARIETYRVQPSIPVLGRLLDVIGQGVKLSGEYIDNRISAREAAKSIKKELSANNDQRAFLNWLILLDDLKAVTAVRLLELVCDPAPSTGSSVYDALVAGLVEYVCHQKGLQSPDWIGEPWRSTEEWYFSGIPELYQTEREESPPPFAKRGIYLLERSLSRA